MLVEGTLENLGQLFQSQLPSLWYNATRYQLLAISWG